MSDIDPTRLSAIFRTLSSKDLMKTNEGGNRANKSEIPNRSVTVQKTTVKDKDDLKKSIKQRILKLKTSDENFSAKIPIITIQEILLWEFGEDIINHPDFNHLSLSITERVTKNGELMAYLQQLIAEIKS
jgi:hypothetical protein